MPPLHRDNGDYKYSLDKDKKLQNRGSSGSNSTSTSRDDNAGVDEEGLQNLSPSPEDVHEYYRAKDSHELVLVPNSSSLGGGGTGAIGSPSAPGWRIVRRWVTFLSFPSALVAYVFTKRVSVALASTMVIPAISVVQGGFAILRYRAFFSQTPFPTAPVHGVVRVITKPAESSSSNQEEEEQKQTSSASATASEQRQTNETSHVARHHHDHDDGAEKTPLRLLVLGDSLAVGVGQSRSATPIMPETIAKSLSKAMGGRPVLWTCHGSPGASAGWIVRELERSTNPFQLQPSESNGNDDEEDGAKKPAASSTTKKNSSGPNSETEDSSSDDSSLEIEHANSTDTAEYQTWHERLKQQRIQFDPHVVAPFDVAVVLTGSNDLKSAFFPFLLKGEDVEFHREAQLRGGGYGRELRRVLEVVSRRMRLRLKTFRESVEAAKVKVRESVDTVMDRMGMEGHHQQHQHHSMMIKRYAHNNDLAVPVLSEHSDTFYTDKMATRTGTVAATSTNGEPCLGDDFDDDCRSSIFPLVVLPGMPARALPLFQSAPLRWIAVPVVDAMDEHKRNLALAHQNEVMFVEAPSVEDISEYKARRGPHWEQRCTDDTILTLRDIKQKHARRIEANMRHFFKDKEQQQYYQEGTTSSSLSQDLSPLMKRRPHYGLFSVDGIHPNDEGYDFWGRYIGAAIVREWRQRNHLQRCSLEDI